MSYKSLAKKTNPYGNSLWRAFNGAMMGKKTRISVW